METHTGLDQHGAAEQSATSLLRASISVISHDIRARLLPIRTFSQMLEAGGLDDENSAEYISRIACNAVRAQRSLDEAVDYLKIAAIEVVPQMLDMSRLIECVSREIDTADLTLSLVQLPAAWADQALVKLAVKAVLQSSAAATPDTSEIRISAIQGTASHTYCFEDTGPPMTESSATRSFEAACGLRDADLESGARPHLACARYAAVRAGGTLEHDAAFDEGTRLCLTLPASQHPPTTPTDPAS